MVQQDVQVVGVDERVLGRGVEEVRRVADDELIDRRAAGDEDRGRSRRAAAGAARALPGRGDRAGVSAITDTSRAPMSIPSSSALVDTTARTCPSRRPRSISRRRLGR